MPLFMAEVLGVLEEIGSGGSFDLDRFNDAIAEVSSPWTDIQKSH